MSPCYVGCKTQVKTAIRHVLYLFVSVRIDTFQPSQPSLQHYWAATENFKSTPCAAYKYTSSITTLWLSILSSRRSSNSGNFGLMHMTCGCEISALGLPRDRRYFWGVLLGHMWWEGHFDLEIGAWEGLQSQKHFLRVIILSQLAREEQNQHTHCPDKQICQALCLLSVQHFWLWGFVEQIRRMMRKHRGNSSFLHIQTTDGVLLGQQTAICHIPV